MSTPVFTAAGTRFGSLVTLEEAARAFIKVRCRCDCGTECSVRVYDLRSGNSQTCGCSRVLASMGDRNAAWKGDEAGYKALHLRVQQLRGTPSCCGRCGPDDPALAYDWANLTGRYEDPNDYERMCRSCHRTFDAARRLAERRRRVGELTAQGLSSRAIGLALGVTHRTVLNDRLALERVA